MVAINEKVTYCFSVCVSDYSLHSVGSAEKVMSLTFRRNINLHMFRDEVVVKKRAFDERSAHSKAVLDDSLITVDTTAHHLMKGLAKKSHKSHNSRIALSTVIFSSVVISLPMT